MSWLTTEWAAYYAPVKSPTEKLVLVGLAHRTDDDGCGAYSSKETLGRVAMCDPKTVQRVLRALESRGIIKPGDPKVVAHLDPRHRPRVYDIQIPYSWYSAAQWDKLNAERTSKGKRPLLPEERPDLAPAPTRTERSDKGKPAPQRRPKSLGPAPAADLGGDARGDSESLLAEIGEPARGDSESLSGGIENPAGGDSESPNSMCDSSLNDSKASLPAVGEGPHRKTDAPADLRSGKEDPQPQQPITEGRAVSPVGMIWLALPEEIRRRVTGRAQGEVLDAIRAELRAGTRTPAQLADRVTRRWARWTALGERIADPRRLALTLVRRTHCPSVACEDGVLIDTGERCVACEGGRPQRRPDPSPTPPASPVGVDPAPRPRPYDRTVADVLRPVPFDPRDWGDDNLPAPAPRRHVGPPKELIAELRAKLGRKGRSEAYSAAQDVVDAVACPYCLVERESWCVDPTTGAELPITESRECAIFARCDRAMGAKRDQQRQQETTVDLHVCGKRQTEE